MGGFFYSLGRRCGPAVRKGRWFYKWLFASETEAIEAEYEVGGDLAKEIRRQVDIIGEGEVADIVRRIGLQLVRCVANKKRCFNFEVIKSAETNAYALPGGYIFVTSSLLGLCSGNENETAFVLAHEMGHVIKGHAIERVLSESAISTMSKKIVMRNKIMGWFQQVGLKFLTNAYSQDREGEADELGVRLMKAAGYDTGAAERILEKLDSFKEGKDQSVLGEYLSTHPPVFRRIRSVRCAASR